jgi:hypothetical protein
MFPSSENIIRDVYPESRIRSLDPGAKNLGYRILTIGKIQDGGPVTCEKEVDISRSAK